MLEPGTVTSVSTVPTTNLAMPRPVWRGKMHSWAFFASIPAGIALIVVASGAAAIVGAGNLLGDAVVAVRYLGGLSPLGAVRTGAPIMQRLDHSMIYLLIAGTYVPMPGCPAPGVGYSDAGDRGHNGNHRHRVEARLLPRSATRVVWAVHRDGLGGDHRHPGAHRQPHRPAQLGLIVAGGVAYTIGFPVLLVHRPNPWPNTFGYHRSGTC